MTQTECPRCHALQARRVKQDGFFQNMVLKRLGYYPWECRFCKATFVLRKRGHRRGDGHRLEQAAESSLSERGHRSPVAGD